LRATGLRALTPRAEELYPKDFFGSVTAFDRNATPLFTLLAAKGKLKKRKMNWM
tara:strand:- start:580 stop:741 length:162 start_codon:yes stop_codon:yes gene_type:complete